MTRGLRIPVDVDQQRQREEAALDKPTGVTVAVTTKKAGKAPAFFVDETTDQSLTTHSMMAFRSASLAADLGWPLPVASFLTAAST